MRYPGLILCCLLLPFILVACSKKGSTARSTAPSATSESQAKSSSGAAPPSNAGTIQLQPVQRSGTSQAKAPSPAPAPPPPANLTGTERLLTLRGQGAVLPDDFVIGALASREPTGTEEGRAVAVIERFFVQLEAGTIDSKLVLPQWRDDLHRRLSHPVSQGPLPTSVRIGRISFDGDLAHAAIRMAREKSWAEGEVYLERRADQWYISDLQVNFSQLDQPYVQKQPFDPAEWKALMKE